MRKLSPRRPSPKTVALKNALNSVFLISINIIPGSTFAQKYDNPVKYKGEYLSLSHLPPLRTFLVHLKQI